MNEDVAEILEHGPQPTAGQLLIEAREAQGLSAADLARQLRLALRQVEALEQNAFDQLPGKTFVRGFIRNYAKMLNIDPEPILEAYGRQSPEPATRLISAPKERITLSQRPSRKWVWYVAGFALVFLIVPLIVYGLLQGGEHRKSAATLQKQPIPVPAPQALAPAPAPAATVPSAVPVVPPAPSAMPPTAEPAPPAPPIASSAPPPVAAQSPKTGAAAILGTVKVQLKFSGDAWVEVRDGDGRKIFSQLNLAGSEQVVEGKPPFQVVAGNAGAVTVVYNGKMIDLHPYTAVNVARFTLQ